MSGVRIRTNERKLDEEAQEEYEEGNYFLPFAFPPHSYILYVHAASEQVCVRREGYI